MKFSAFRHSRESGNLLNKKSFDCRCSCHSRVNGNLHFKQKNPNRIGITFFLILKIVFE
ncbi:MAG: hypothetical protein OXJ52_06080 [Oligoflexia bacterium]|nr:hypothetical protein [Oligoflexia bacterium]